MTDEPAPEDAAAAAPDPYQKPRKASSETLDYLEAFVNDDAAPRHAARNVAEELRYEAASVAADKRGGVLLEELARRCGPKTVEKLFTKGLGPYAGFLAYHRHGSHVLQTLLAL